MIGRGRGNVHPVLETAYDFEGYSTLPRVLVVTCDVLFMCDGHGSVTRTMRIGDLLSVFFRTQGFHREILLRPEHEHDTLFSFDTASADRDVVHLLEALSHHRAVSSQLCHQCYAYTGVGADTDSRFEKRY